MSVANTCRSGDIDPIQIGFVGVGSMAETVHLPSVARHPLCQIVALIDPFADEKRLQELSHIFGCPWYRSADNVSMDLAFFATPISKHVEVALPIVKRGIHAFIEKPLAHCVDAAQQLLDAAEVANSRVFCGHVRRFNDNVKLANELVSTDFLGPINKVSLHFGGLYGWHRRFFSDKDDADRSIDESVLFDLGAHGIDSLLSAAGPALGEISLTKAIVDDPVVCNDIELTAVSRNASDEGGDVEIYAALSNTTNLANVIWIKAQNGTLALSLTDPNSLILFPKDCLTGINLSSTNGAISSPFPAQLDSILNGLTNGRSSEVEGHSAVPTVLLLEQASKISEPGHCSWLGAQ